MNSKELLILLDEYDAAWQNLQERNISELTSAERNRYQGDDFRPLFMRAADISFKIIEAYQKVMGTHTIPTTTRKDNRLDTEAIRSELAALSEQSLADA